MHRIQNQEQAEAIRYALSFVSPTFRGIFEHMSAIHFMCGTRPKFAGLHAYDITPDGRSYDTTAHVCFDFHQEGMIVPVDRRPTVCLPAKDSLELDTLLHEIGHVIHWAYDFEDFNLPDVSDYASTDPGENFAEAFTAYAIPYGWGYAEAKNRLTRDDYAMLDVLLIDENDEWLPTWRVT